MPLVLLRIAFLVALLGGVTAGTPAGAQQVRAVETPGSGVLTKCRDWLITYTCRKYHHIDVPMRVSVGQSITLDFGSNPKEFAFPVARIALDGEHCTLYSEAEGDPDAMDRIDIDPCSAVSAVR